MVKDLAINPEKNEAADKIGDYGGPEISKKREAGDAYGENRRRELPACEIKGVAFEHGTPPLQA
jgi:hypothetical protein